MSVLRNDHVVLSNLRVQSPYFPSPEMYVQSRQYSGYFLSFFKFVFKESVCTLPDDDICTCFREGNIARFDLWLPYMYFAINY